MTSLNRFINNNTIVGDQCLTFTNEHINQTENQQDIKLGVGTDGLNRQLQDSPSLKSWSTWGLFPIILKCSKENKEKENSLNSCYKISVTLVPKEKNLTEKVIAQQFLMNIDIKILSKILANQSQQYIKESYNMSSKRLS